MYTHDRNENPQNNKDSNQNSDSTWQMKCFLLAQKCAKVRLNGELITPGVQQIHPLAYFHIIIFTYKKYRM